MEVDREKTRLLAQAMSISLEKQAAARAIALRNEDAVREAAAAIDARMAAAAKPDNQPIDGPAQRFVLMPDAANGGAQRLTAAMLRTPDSSRAPETSGMPEFSRLASHPASTPVVRASSAAASISPTHSSVDAVSAFVEAKPAARESELDAISEFVGRVLKRGGAEGQTVASAAATATAASTASSPAPSAASSAGTSAGTCPATPSRPRSIEAAHAHLLEQELDSDLAARIIDDVAKQFASAGASAGASSQPSDADVRHALEQRLVAILPSDDEDPFAMAPGANGARRIAFVGPTGVGKTTTLAKIAAQLKLKRGLRVGIVAADTYRIAAVDQLRTYAEILGLPVEVASSPKDAARACASLSDVDVILIDTAGRSQNDHMKISELRAFLASAAPDETHLVLSATASARTLARAAETFGAVGVNRIVLTKLDEAATFGTLVSLVERLGKRVSFFTQGQEVPDHIEIARSRRLAALILGSEVR
jgi:flagellar biosynthesis protein FlhF